MIIGSKDVDAYDVREHCTSVPSLRQYSDSLVPRILSHNMQIINNQRYYIAMIVRTIVSIPYAERKSLYEGLLEGVGVTGCINEIYDFEDLVRDVDIERLADFVKRGGIKDVKGV